jgi:hypothetical protein
LCASFMPLGHDVTAEVGCNWYLHDTNICALSKNIYVHIFIPTNAYMHTIFL